MTKVSNRKLLAIAVILSLITAILIYNYLKGITARQVVQQGVSVIVAKTDIAPKTKVTAEMVKEIKVPPEYIQPGAVQSMDKVVGIIVREQVIHGEQISERRLVREGRLVGLPGVIPRDKRAVTVAVNEVTGVAGFVKAGDYIDVVVTFDTAAVGDHVSYVLMQNILVLAANRDMEMTMPDTTTKEITKESKEITKAATVTMAVTPEEAVKLTLAEEKGKIRLALRPYLPLNSVVLTESITPKDLVGSHISPAKEHQATPYQQTPSEQPVSAKRQELSAPKSQSISDNQGIKVIRGTKMESIPAN